MSIKPRLTQEQAAKADLFGVQCPSVLTTETERVLSGRILDLLDLLRAATARAEQAEKDRDALAAVAHLHAVRGGGRAGMRVRDASRAVEDAVSRRTPARPHHRGGKGMTWQQIETAPMDGRVLLLGYYNQQGEWCTFRSKWTGVETAEPSSKKWNNAPTHWMEVEQPEDKP